MPGSAFVTHGGGANYLFHADDVVFDITGPLCIYGWFYQQTPNASTLGRTGMISKWNSTGGNRSYMLAVPRVNVEVPANNERMAMYVSSNGTAQVSAIGTTNYFSHVGWIFAAGMYEPSTSVRVYSGTVPGNIALETDTTIGVPASLFNSTAEFRVASFLESTAFRWGIGVNHVGVLTAAPTLKQLNELSWGVPPRILFPNNVAAYYRPYAAENPELDLTKGGKNLSHFQFQANDFTAPALHFTKGQTARLTAAITATDTGHPYLYGMQVPPMRPPERIITSHGQFQQETVVVPPTPEAVALDMGQPLPERTWRAVPYKT